MKLVIVESPAKAQTINKYLGNNYKVVALLDMLEIFQEKMVQLNQKKNFRCHGTNL